MVLVICRPAKDADASEFARHIPDEAAALRQLKEAGTLVQAWSPGGPGAVLLLDVPDSIAAAQVAAQLPLAASGLITTEIIPLQPRKF
jgi:muconolactone delta-isomerase